MKHVRWCRVSFVTTINHRTINQSLDSINPHRLISYEINEIFNGERHVGACFARVGRGARDVNMQRLLTVEELRTIFIITSKLILFRLIVKIEV